MYKLVLLRHGESQWNRDNRFTGWTDVDLDHISDEEIVKLEIPTGVPLVYDLDDALSPIKSNYLTV